METKQARVRAEEAAEVVPPGLPGPPGGRQALPPKGSCWYCAKPLDSVRRFCGKDCAGAFDEEAQYPR